jgi:hypothetical protein
MLFKYLGRDYETYNCFDLVKEFYKDHYNLDLINYFEGDKIPGRKEIESLIATNKGDFVKVGNPKFGDVVVINLYGYSCHIGVYLGRNRLLHSVRGAGSCIDSISRYSKIIDGFYRHREIVSA